MSPGSVLSLDLFLMFDFVVEFFVVDYFVGSLLVVSLLVVGSSVVVSLVMNVSLLIYVSSLVNVFGD